MSTIIAYYRVSTKRQGESGLGLEAQEAAVTFYARQAGAAIKAAYTEVESGKRADRPQLALAIAHAKRSKATLVVAKLDRLARNVAFLSALMECKVPFVACDNPHANCLTLHILAAVAEAEAKAISERTRAALAAAKARGTLLGSSRPEHWLGRESERLAGLAKARAVAAILKRKQAAEAYADIIPRIAALRQSGHTLRAIADTLNADGHTTRSGLPWSAARLVKVLRRIL